MRLYGLLCALVVTACASASPPSEGPTDARMVDGKMVPIDGPPGDMMIAVDSMPSVACMSAMTCAGAMMLGPVSGDTGAGKVTASGYQSAWFRLRVTEDDDDILGIVMTVTSKLTFPATVGFETYVYLNAGNDVAAECAITTGTRSTVGNVQEVEAAWGETGAFSNGSSDSRNVTVEVRPVGTNCSAAQTWSLEVIGNT
jgi:hypothetical protein